MSKISELTNKATPATTDELAIVDNAGTPATKKATLGSLPVSTPQGAAITSAVEDHAALTDTHGATASPTPDRIALRDAEGATGLTGVQFDVDNPATLAKGMVRWNDQDKTLDVGVSATEAISIGQELGPPARNASGGTLANGTVCYVDGATGQLPTISPAVASDAVQAQSVIGFVTDAAGIANNQQGRVTTFGMVRDLDTSAYTEGDVLYLSAVTPGAFTNVKPTGTNHVVKVGVVIHAHITQGIILAMSHYRGTALGDSLMTAETAADARAAIDAAGLVGGKLDPEEFPETLSARLQVLTGTDAALANEVLLAGEIAAPTDATGLRKGDGVTPGGSLVGRIATPATAAAGTSSTECVGPNGLLVVGTLASGATNGSVRLSQGVHGSLSFSPDALGVGAIDIQTFRASSSRAATGLESLAIGVSNEASGSTSLAIGRLNISSNTGSFSFGANVTSSGQYSTGIGYISSATGDYSVSIGRRCVASGSYSVSLGGHATGPGTVATTASGDYSLSQGFAATASGRSSFAHGERVIADRHGMAACASGRFSSDGDAQRVDFVARNKTTTNSAVTLFLDGSSTRLTIPSGKVLAATINVSGVKSDGTAMAHFIRKASIKNVGGTTTLVSLSTIGTDDAAGTSLAITADDTNDALEIAVTGITSETWRWVAHIEGVEIAYGT